MNTEIRRLSFYKEAADIFTQYRNKEKAAFLDSALKNAMGRYSVIGLYPYMVLKEEEGICFLNGERQSASFEEVMDRQLKEQQEDNPTNLPLVAGAIGYFSYDYGRKFERIKTRHPGKIRIPDAQFVFYDVLIIEDKKEKVLYLTARGKTADAGTLLNETEWEIEQCTPLDKPDRQYRLAEFKANFEKEEYKHTIEKMIRYIMEGDIYIANMTQQLMVDSAKDPYEVYRYLRTYNPAPFAGYLNYENFQIVGASPESFLWVRDGIIETRPIKGTRKRGCTPREDQAYRKELQASPKDRSELLMIVDLERNDLNHVCEPGSVRVTEHFAVEVYATVFHLVTTIRGKIKEDVSLMELIRAAFPGGSITGAPKIRAMEIIDELEQDRRGLYTGSMGYISLDGSCSLNIMIRTAIHQNGKYYLGVGGGITCESEPEFEYEETLQKAKALLEAIYDGKESVI